MRTIVDSSVWIDFLWKKELPHVKLLRTMLEQDEDIATCGVIVTEVLQGIRDDRQFITMEAQLKTLSYLDLSLTHFITAAQIYRTLRSQGLTIRKPIDCMIAAVALEQQAALLHNDRDFEAIATQFPLPIRR
jgi:predicted nucleic acid-binding protein